MLRLTWQWWTTSRSYKKIQEWATIRDLYLMWSAASTSMVEFTKKVHNLLADNERAFCVKYPHEFELHEHGGEFPPMGAGVVSIKGRRMRRRRMTHRIARSPPRVPAHVSFGWYLASSLSQGLKKREFGDHTFFQNIS